MSGDARPGGGPARPARTGSRWTDEDYGRLVTMCREGRDLDELTEALSRSEQSVLDRARRMLPPEERGLPRDRAVARLQERLREDPGYDWSAALLQGPPPRPVEHVVYRSTGLDGLHRHELLAVAEALVQVEHVDGQLRNDVLRAVEEHGLDDELARQVGSRIVRRAQEQDSSWTLEQQDRWWVPAQLDPDEPYRPWCGPDCPDDLPPPEEEPEPWW